MGGGEVAFTKQWGAVLYLDGKAGLAQQQDVDNKENVGEGASHESEAKQDLEGLGFHVVTATKQQDNTNRKGA